MQILETERLTLRHLTLDDAEFIVEMLNDPGFLRFIGDRNVRNVEDACRYLENGALSSYEKNGFGLYMVQLKDSGTPIGMCGLIRRDILEHVDIGYSLLERFTGKGYGSEAAAAMLKYGYEVIGLDRIVAITDPENEASARVLEKIGLRFEKMLDLPEYGVSKLFVPADE